MSSRAKENGAGRLRETLDAACAERGCSMEDLTVLSRKSAYRLDTPANHRDGEWLAATVERLGLGDGTIHLRGLHYLIASSDVRKPDRRRYRNSDEDWTWLEEKAAKAARWLGYIDFEVIVDHRNAAPVIVPFEPVELEPFVSVGFEVYVPPAAEALTPGVSVEGFDGLQRHKLEQTEIDSLLSLRPDLLGEIARDAIRPFYDYTLALRVAEARREWVAVAQEALAEQLDAGRLAEIHTEGTRTFSRFRREVQGLNDRLAAAVGDVEDYELPEPVIPEPQIDVEPHGEPLIDSAWRFAEQSRRLKADREYELVTDDDDSDREE